MRVALLILLALTASYGEEPILWPKPLKENIEFRVTKPSKLPAGLKFGQITVEGLEPHDVGICWLDLNQDEEPELLVDTHEGGTGGSYKRIFVKTDTGFRCIANWMGGITLVTPANGYLQIESWSSAGGGEFSRMLFRFEKKRYHMVRLEDWKGFGDDAGWKFIRSRDPKKYDHE